MSNDRLFKILFLDVGLMQSACGLDAAIAAAGDFLAINSGAVAEQFAGQELLAYAPAYEDTNLFFWSREKRGSQAEVDYLSAIDGSAVPIEVKARSTGRLRSLKEFMNAYTAASACGSHRSRFRSYPVCFPFLSMRLRRFPVSFGRSGSRRSAERLMNPVFPLTEA